MGRCSYTWKEKDSEKDEIVKKYCQNETWEGSSEYCIFHEPSPDKDVDLFKEKLEEKMEFETDKHTFNGYYFPESWDFFDQKFEIDADFYKATFQYANFSETTFQYADFTDATFRYVHFTDAAFRYVHFTGATFQVADFEEATFQVADFEEATFQVADFGRADFQDADFEEATFRYVHFTDANFQGYVHFTGATFQGRANFIGTTFQDVGFSRVTFQGDANFSEATFQDADFTGARIKEFFEFNPKEVSGILDLRGTKFFFSGSITTDLENTLFHRSHLQNVAFVDCEWPNDYIIYEEKHMNDKGISLSFNQLETIYRDLKQTIQNHGDYSTAGEFYYREMEMRRKGATKKNRIWLEVYRLLAGYGEKPQRTLLSSLFTISIFALLYWVLECLQYPARNLTLLHQIKYAVYFSFVTFTTLGLGDIHPVNDWGIVLICIEAVIGAFLIALFVVVFARKMMR